MMTKEELSKVLKVSTRTIQRWLSDDIGLPHYKVGNVLRFDLEAVKEWMKNKEG